MGGVRSVATTGPQIRLEPYGAKRELTLWEVHGSHCCHGLFLPASGPPCVAPVQPVESTDVEPTAGDSPRPREIRVSPRGSACARRTRYIPPAALPTVSVTTTEHRIRGDRIVRRASL